MNTTFQQKVGLALQEAANIPSVNETAAIVIKPDGTLLVGMADPRCPILFVGDPMKITLSPKNVEAKST